MLARGQERCSCYCGFTQTHSVTHTLTRTDTTAATAPPPRYLYCNLPGFELAQARPSRLYFFALGGSGDVHTPNSAEGSFYLDGQRRQGVTLLPGTMMTTDIQ